MAKSYFYRVCDNLNIMKIWTSFIFVLWVFCGSSFAQALFQGSGEREDWMGTYFQGKKMGFTKVITRWNKESIEVGSTVFFQIRSESVEQSTIIKQQTRLGLDLQVQGFSLLKEINGHRQQIEARVQGDRLVYHMKSSGFDKEKSMVYPSGTLPSSTFLLNLIANGLQIGQKGTIPLFLEPFQIFTDLEYEVLRKENLEYEGKSVKTFVVRQRYSGIETIIWVAGNGSVMKESTNQGFESFKESPEKAQKIEEPITISNIITMSLIKPERPIDRPERIRKITFGLHPVGSAYSIPEDHRQRIINTEQLPDGSYRISLEVESEMDALLESQGVPDPKYLEGTAEVQADHPMILALARELTGDTNDPWLVAKEINRWVFLNLEKELVDTVSALDALHERRGECQSHTYLFTAVARAAKIPTRIVNGLVYSKGYSGFLYHAWPEVYIGGWRALDPTLGQVVVDATHIKLTEGASPLRLMEFVGKIKIDWSQP